MKQAYASLALRWHPDRQGTDDADALARARHRMAELNAAWAVLRNPAARAAYDQELAGRSAPAAGAATGGRRDDLVRDAAVLDPEVRRPSAPATARRQPWGCLLVALGVVAAFAALTAYAATRSDDQVEVETREPLAVGACALVGEEGGQTVLVEVPCGEPHDAEVVARSTFPQACPTSTAAVLLPGGQNLVCLRQVGPGAP